ncbi:hypothetical protein EAH89_14650 [Roseomonas nepalensis]|uniref:Uncharacterized protein n=1 Tax=Muricoccus nepalensis TaxID=1854500 RepID=A0A502G0P2_9PROT|nr:hypothetical protein [Roseomonas nepalensis]TPG55487.1 hypothetical protein EAH89_14650 [Roseomonas nepalensis]
MRLRRVAPEALKRVAITPGLVARVVGVIQSWDGDQITWAGLVDRTDAQLGYRWTRQALERHPEIKVAYKLCREESSRRQRKVILDPADSIYLQRAEKLAAEVAKLKAQLTAFEEQFALYQYNAHMRGVSAADLAQPMPVIDRGWSVARRANGG